MEVKTQEQPLLQAEADVDASAEAIGNAVFELYAVCTSLLSLLFSFLSSFLFSLLFFLFSFFLVSSFLFFTIKRQKKKKQRIGSCSVCYGVVELEVLSEVSVVQVLVSPSALPP